jgi:pimeloyl-ACP methyl ester carboxylesterase
MPTLLVRGELSDVLDEADARAMVERIPDARLVTVSDAGHSVALERPARFIEALGTFL